MTPALNNRCLTRAVMGANLDAALADCREALTLMPDDPYAHDNIGLIYLKRRQWDRAIDQYNAPLKVDPDRARALCGRGLARTRNGQAPAGITDMSTASGIQPNIAGEFKKYA
jgi:tetratricopeptide (TPR) repeat protein